MVVQTEIFEGADMFFEFKAIGLKTFESNLRTHPSHLKDRHRYLHYTLMAIIKRHHQMHR